MYLDGSLIVKKSSEAELEVIEVILLRIYQLLQHFVAFLPLHIHTTQHNNIHQEGDIP
jgi:hypothetical protein